MIPIPARLGHYDPAKQLRAQDAAAKAFAAALAVFLSAAFPQAAGAVDDLCDAFVGFICVGTDEQLKAYEESRSLRLYQPPKLEDELIRLTAERDQITSQLETFQDAIESLSSKKAWKGSGKCLKLSRFRRSEANLLLLRRNFRQCRNK
jgi:hypothetical protein